MNEKINVLLRHPATLPTATAVAGFAAGAVIGYWRGKKSGQTIVIDLETKSDDAYIFEHPEFDFDAQDDEPNEKLIASVHKLREIELDEAIHQHPATESKTVREIKDAILEPNEVNDEVHSIEDDDNIVKGEFKQREGVVVNVFDTGGDEWDYKTEVENRDKSKPYTIHVDEYVADEMGWDSQSTLTYYEKDDVLCDSRDVPIYNHTEVVGELRFGHGSNDANVVYIRNEERQEEFEVLRDSGSYEETVLGETMHRMTTIDELKHSQNRKFRDD